MKQIPSIYQSNIYNEVKTTNNSIRIKASAGSGKTTTIVRCLDYISANADVMMLAFNRAIRDELQTRVPSYINVNTLHGFGYGMLRMNLGGKIILADSKIFNIGVKMVERWQITENKYSYVARINKIVDFMRYNLLYDDNDQILEMLGKYGVNVFGDEIFHAKEVLDSSNKKVHEQIDYADMIYLPAVRNFKIKKFDVVIVDEAQDLNKAQHEIIKKMLKPKGRLISVGDEFQSIYMFAGADSDSFENIKNIVPNTVDMPLSVCYRSTKAIVRHAQEIVPSIEYFEGADEGVEPRDGSVNEIMDKAFVLCRNTKPLIQLFIILLKRGLKANIKGKEIGDGIINVIKKTNQKTVEGMLKHLGVHKIKLKSKLLSKGIIKTDKHPQMLEYDEKVEIIGLLAERFSSVKQLIDFISTIFLDEKIPGIILSTIHKSKGLEADKVYILCPHLMPSQFAITPEALKQEQNLMYVARTRAKKELIYIRDFVITKEVKNQG